MELRIVSTGLCYQTAISVAGILGLKPWISHIDVSDIMYWNGYTTHDKNYIAT